MATRYGFRFGRGPTVVGMMAVMLASSLPVHSETLIHTDSVAWPAALADEELATLRGGFLVGDLEISIGLEQVVAINGETLVVNRLTIPDLNQQILPEEVDQILETTLTVPADGLPAGTVINTEINKNSAILTHIQNSLDETVIQTLRQLNIELNNFDPNQVKPGYQDTQYLDVLHLH